MASSAGPARVDELREHVGRTVEVRGWLYNRRSSGKIHFLLVRDGTGVVQAVLSRADAPEEAFALVGRIPQESSVVVTGEVRADPRAPGGVELAVRALRLVHEAEPYPITPKEHGVEFLMDHRHLWLRSARQHAVLRVRAEIIRAMTDYLDARGYLRVDAPILTPAAAEGTTTLFETTYFDLGPAYLTQSGQLYNEAAAMAFGRVYCFGPTFRAEKSKTRRHLIEFWMLEPEAAYMELDEYMALAEEFVASVVARVLERRRSELAVLERDLAPLERVRAPFPRISYDEALRLLAERGLRVPWGEDLGGDEETALASAFDRPVFVHRYPVQCKAFYMQPDPKRPEVVLGADLLAPEGYGEIIGGGQRIHDLALLERRLVEHNLPPEPYRWYLDLRRYGSVPHSGFGIGIERTVAWICGLDHVRETIPFPRLLNRLYP
ncbi:MAG: asparagine--tRNA ligase [Armatimonadota bacterium]|nr:asparagine--tRNA ligase [Armatimonadota bacterium]MDR7453726.1 asparagine--tRNA ligase [Armatimonadota bacterium]MDR7456399.1 asparagine--tRNA ligase [Armatimonadota bacterium]MDR7496695.1 asparagine--tRNA ligase [Armatimonadota bacterium]MDR7511513.1 asparagine--tRNA ligase [Armatimonadota bacterium]